MEILRLRQKLKEKDDQLDAYKVDIASTRFNPTSVSGQKLMHKCRALLEENRSLGRQINEGPIRDLLIAWGLEKGRNDELASKLKAREDFVKILDDENEKLQVAAEVLTSKVQKLVQFAKAGGLDPSKVLEEATTLASGQVVGTTAQTAAAPAPAVAASSSSSGGAAAPPVQLPAHGEQAHKERRERKEGERERDRDRRGHGHTSHRDGRDRRRERTE